MAYGRERPRIEFSKQSRVVEKKPSNGAENRAFGLLEIKLKISEKFSLFLLKCVQILCLMLVFLLALFSKL